VEARTIDEDAAARELSVERARATKACVSLATAGFAHGAAALVTLWIAGPLIIVQSFFLQALSIVWAIFFLRWWGAAFRTGVRLGASVSSRLGRRGMLGFFIPIENFYRPYLALRELDRAIDPSRLPPPPPAPRADGRTPGYRVPALVQAAAAETPPPPLGTWWALWLAPMAALPFTLSDDPVVVRVGLAYGQLVHVLSAAAAFLVVRRIDVRLSEYARRVAVKE
jgi:hypothetical protein